MAMVRTGPASQRSGAAHATLSRKAYDLRGREDVPQTQ